MAKDRVEAGRGRGKGKVVNAAGPGRSPGRGDKRPFYIAVAVLVIGGIGTLSYLATRSNAVSRIDSTVAPIPNQGHVIGSDSAKVEVVEYADFECPACGNFANLTEPDVRARLVNTGVIRFRFVDFPLDMHPNTWSAHSAAWCAGDQGKFWEMHDLLFQNQDRWSTQVTKRPDNVIRPLAQQLTLDMGRYDSCIQTRKFHPQIRANYDEAIKRGIPSTPTFHIGATQLVGVRNYDEFKRHVDAALAASKGADTARGARTGVPRGAAAPR